MSRSLMELLGASEPMFSLNLRRLEAASGRANLDIKLVSDISAKVRAKIKQFGLDDKDTNGPEMYHALLHLTKLHDEHLANALGGKELNNSLEMLLRIINFVKKMDFPKTVWALKPVAAKRLLLSRPPKNLMKYWGYRSVDSLLKRENIVEIYAALKIVESDEWMASFMESYKKLTPADFESREIEILILDNDRWGKIVHKLTIKNQHNIINLIEIGAIILLPLSIENMPGVTITYLTMLLQNINESRLYSSYFKHRQMKSNFGEILFYALTGGLSKVASMAGHNIHWDVIRQHYAKNNHRHPEMFEPYVQPEDFAWRKAEEMLYKIEPSLSFWRDLDWVGKVYDNCTVSLNIMDMAVNYANNLEYGQQSTKYMKDSLWNELYVRYMGEKSLEQEVLKQLDHEIGVMR